MSTTTNTIHVGPNHLFGTSDIREQYRIACKLGSDYGREAEWVLTLDDVRTEALEVIGDGDDMRTASLRSVFVEAALLAQKRRKSLESNP